MPTQKPKRRANPSTQPPAAQPNLADLWQPLATAANLQVAPDVLAQLQTTYLQDAMALWNATLQSATPGHPPEQPPKPIPDRRFGHASWANNPASNFVAQMYLLNARTLMGLTDAVQTDEKTHNRLRFGVQQWIDAASPSNYLALNPEALTKALETKGGSITDGMANLIQDMQQGTVSHTDTSAFEVGRNVASSEGSVVFENELFQLIEYKPLTAQVHERPMLFVPPCINKFYILDLQPDNSLIRYTVQQGHRTFVVSWRNPDDSIAHKTWDDYIEHGAIQAIRTTQAISGARTIDTLGFCVGGTILATALAVLAARNEHPAQSLTLLTTLLDFSDTGVLDVFIDEQGVKHREATIGPDAPGGPGLLRGQELATTFNFLRPNDLVWNYVVGNYLKGESPPPFDLLYWNGDATNLPGPMFVWYLRHLYLQDELKQPGTLTVCGEKVDLRKIKAPVYLYGSREDHIVPWTAAVKSLPLLQGPSRFVLGASGHIAGVINPPSKNKRNYWTDGSSPTAKPKAASAASAATRGKARAQASAASAVNPQAWLAAATEHPGSWWTDWAAWLQQHAGKMVAAPKKPGNARHPVIEAAPGRYVKVRAS
jgi:polyhydroxyalkanoate synthase subunit PhaC